jgi:hypothetical protein
MPLAASIEFPRGDVDALFRQIDRAQKDLGKSMARSVSWAAAYVAHSLAAATRVAPKLRRVVENPDKRYKTDHRRAPFGVMRYNPDGTQFFKPIYRTGEYGKLRFFDKKSVSWFKRDRTTGAGHWEKLPSGPDIANPDIFVPGIMTDKRRKIGRRGLAKKAWTWAAGRAYSGGTGNIMGVSGAADVHIYRDKDNPGVRITDHLRYATAAFKSPGAVEGALGSAARKLEYNIIQKLNKLPLFR